MTGTVLNPHFVASQGGYSRDRAIGVYARMGSNFAVCVNDWEMARYVLARGGTPILRIRCPDDDDADARFDPVEYVDTCHAQLSAAEAGIPGAAGRGVIHLGNELGSATPERTARWLETGIRRITFHKRKALASNWSVKNPEESMHAELARFGVYTAIRANGGWMGYHEGAYIDPHTGETFRSFEECFAGGCIGGWREAAQQYGFRVCITEFAASKTPVDGWSTWMSESEFTTLCDKAAKFYAAQGVIAHIYTAFQWDRGTGFEYVEATTLQAEFAKINERYPVMTQPTIPDYSGHNWGQRIGGAKVVATANSNVRNQPDESVQPVVGTLKNGDSVTYWSSPFQGRNHHWYKVLFGGQERFVAAGAHLRFENPPAPEPEPEPELPPGSVVLTPAQYQTLQGIHAALGTFIQEVAPALLPGSFPVD